MTKVKICPSILENDINLFYHTLSKLLPFFNYFQIDIIDESFAEEKTISIKELVDFFSKNQERFSKNSFDFHLMVAQPEKYFQEIETVSKLITIKNIFIHFKFFQENFLNRFSKINVGLAINPDETIETIRKKFDLKKLKIFQIMSVIPGAQGKPFIENTLKKIEQIKNTSYKSLVFLDGGINEKTILKILSQKYPPDFLCPGSFLTKVENDQLKKHIDFLKKIINNNNTL